MPRACLCNELLSQKRGVTFSHLISLSIYFLEWFIFRTFFFCLPNFRTSPFISFTASHFGLPNPRATYPVPPQSVPFSTPFPVFGQEPEFPWNCQDVEVYFPFPLATRIFFLPPPFFSRYFLLAEEKCLRVSLAAPPRSHPRDVSECLRACAETLERWNYSGRHGRVCCALAGYFPKASPLPRERMRSVEQQGSHR